MKVTVLGSGTSTGVPVVTCDCAVCRSDDPRDRRLRPSVRVEWEGASILIDTATDLRQQVLRFGIDRIDAVLYTHHHADHVLGLDELRLFNWRQRSAIPAFGSAQTLERLKRTFWYVFEKTQEGGGKPSIVLRPVDRPFPLLGRTIVPVPVLHGNLPIEGFRIGDFAYLTDVSGLPDEAFPMLTDLDALILNALRPRPHPSHLSLDEALALAEQIGARRTFFTHLSHEMPHEETSGKLPEGVELAYDGLTLEL